MPPNQALIRCGMAHGSRCCGARIVHPEEKPAGVPGTVFLWEKKPVVITSDGYLALMQVQMAGKRPMDGGAFVRGKKDFVGTTFESP